jgi:hypothetical protein
MAMVYKMVTAYCMLAFTMTVSSIASADTANKITIVNTSGRPFSVTFAGVAKCMSKLPKEGVSRIGVEEHIQFSLVPDSTCGESSIQFTLRMALANPEHPQAGGTLTYRKYKGTNRRWLQKVEFVPTGGATFFNFLRATCGEGHELCLGIGIPFSDAQAYVAVLNPGLDTFYIGYGRWNARRGPPSGQR